MKVLFLVVVAMLDGRALLAQSTLTPVDLHTIIQFSLQARRELMRDSISVSACSVYRLLPDSARVRSLAGRADVPRFSGPFGPGCSLPPDSVRNVLVLQQVLLTPEISDPLTLRLTANDPK